MVPGPRTAISPRGNATEGPKVAMTKKRGVETARILWMPWEIRDIRIVPGQEGDAETKAPILLGPTQSHRS